MRKEKPFRVITEQVKCNFIEIVIFKRQKGFSFSLSTFIGAGGLGLLEAGIYSSCSEAKNAALHYVYTYYTSEQPEPMIRKFRLMKDLDQPVLFYD